MEKKIDNRFAHEKPLRLVTHRQPMLDPENSFDEEGIREFHRRVQRVVGKDDRFDYTVEPKIDGASVEMIYETGRLILASTRGDGYVGEDITPNIKTLLSVPLTLQRFSDGLPIPDLLEVRGYVYIEKDAFNQLIKERARKGLSSFASPKNASEAFLRDTDLRTAARSPLTVFCSGVGELRGHPFQTNMELMIGLQQWGLRVNRPHIRVCHSLDDVIEYCLFLDANRSQFPFDMDGVVIKVNQRYLQSRFVRNDGCPRWALAYKFNPVRPESSPTEMRHAQEKRMENIRVRLIIEGRVQGVWFRDSTRRQAVGLGVFGWVKNRADRRVEVMAEGPEDKVKKLISWCHHGPRAARVTSVIQFPEAWIGEFDSFDIVF